VLLSSWFSKVKQLSRQDPNPLTPPIYAYAGVHALNRSISAQPQDKRCQKNIYIPEKWICFQIWLKRNTSLQGSLQLFCSFLLSYFTHQWLKWQKGTEISFYTRFTCSPPFIAYIGKEPFHVPCVYKKYNIDGRIKQRCHVNCMSVPYSFRWQLIEYHTYSLWRILWWQCWSNQPLFWGEQLQASFRVFEIEEDNGEMQTKLQFNKFPEHWWNYR
jgi:hypothetical protein